MKLIVQLCLCLGLTAAGAMAGEEYDLLIRNGRVLDGSGCDYYYADVAIKGDRIAAVGKVGGTAKRTLDVSGMVVAPGFIDVHTHADDDLLKLPAAENFIRDGVTTIITGNCGYGMREVGKYLDAVEEKKIAVNVGTLIGHNTVLRAVKGDKAGKLTDEQMADAQQIVRDAMLQGAVGFSTGLIYTPGTYSDTEEIIALAKVSAEFGGIYATHMRSESGEILAAIDEALRVGREAGCRVEISHFKLPVDVARRIGGADATLGKVLAARSAGQEVWLDQYPYTASSTSISTLLPDWLLEVGADNARKRLSDPAEVDRIVEEMRQTYEVKRGRKSLAYVVIASCRAFPQYAGKNLLQVTQLRKAGKNELLSDAPGALPEVSMADQCRTVVDIFVAGGASCVFHSMAEPEVETIMRSPLVSIASDSGVRDFGSGTPHPRGYGTNARVLGEYVRKRKVISLPEAIRKMTSQPATAFRLADRGRIIAGGYADITIFDPQTVTDRATFEKPHQYSTGFAAVIVNGQVVLESDKMTEARPGRGLRGPGWK